MERNPYGDVSTISEHADKDRSYRIMSQLFNELEYYGFKISPDLSYPQIVTYEDKTFEVRIWGFNELSIRIWGEGLGYVQTGFHDGKRKKLESRLSDVIHNLFKGMAMKIDNDIKETLRKENYEKVKPRIREMRIQANKLEEKREREAEEENRIEAEFARWQRSIQIRNFIKSKIEHSGGEDISDWLKRANNLADVLDPFTDVYFTESERMGLKIDRLKKEARDLERPFEYWREGNFRLP